MYITCDALQVGFFLYIFVFRECESVVGSQIEKHSLLPKMVKTRFWIHHTIPGYLKRYVGY